MRYLVPIAILITGCHDWGPEQTEEARVVKLTHVPSTLQTDIVLMPHFDGKGNVGFTPTPVTSGHRAYYVVEFECPHGRFHIDRQQVWSRMHEGDLATVTFREDRKSPGTFDFLDAWPLARTGERKETIK